MKKNTMFPLVLTGVMILQGFGGFAYASDALSDVNIQTSSTADVPKLTYNGKEIPLGPNGDFALSGKKWHIDPNGDITYNGSYIGNMADFPGLMLTNQTTGTGTAVSSGWTVGISRKTHLLTYKGTEVSLRNNGVFFLNGKMGRIDATGNITYKGSYMGNIANSPDFNLTKISATTYAAPSVTDVSDGTDAILCSLSGDCTSKSTTKTVSNDKVIDTANDGTDELLCSLLGDCAATTPKKTTDSNTVNPYKQNLPNSILEQANAWLSKKILPRQDMLSPDEFNAFIGTAIEKFEQARGKTKNKTKLNAINYTLYELDKLQNDDNLDDQFFDNILGSGTESPSGWLDDLLGWLLKEENTGTTTNSQTSDGLDSLLGWLLQ